MRIFVNVMNGLGDLFLTMHTIRELKLRADAEITVLCWYYLEDVVKAFPFVDIVMPWTEEYQGDEGLEKLRALVAKSGPFDVSIDFAFPPRSAMISRATGAPIKLMVMPGDTVFDDIEFIEREQHHGIASETMRVLDRLKIDRPSTIAPPHLWLQGEDFVAARRIVAELDLDKDQPLVMIHPGAGVPARRWADERYAQLADALVDRYGAKVLFLGGRKDQMSIIAMREGIREEDTVERILNLARHRHASAAGRDNTRVLALLLEESDLFIGNNSGPGHIAGQIGARTLILWGPSNPPEWKPLGPDVALAMQVEGLDCFPCSPRGCDEPVCMDQLTVTIALETIEKKWPGLPLRRRRLPVAVEIASGERPHPGYIHLDARRITDVDIIGEATRMPLARGRVRQIHAQHIIEHFPTAQLDRILGQWVATLEPGGAIQVVTPNLAYIASGYADGSMPTEEAVTRLYGEQNYPGNFHFTLFDKRTLQAALERAGCHPVYDMTRRFESRKTPMSLYMVGFRPCS
ncbi:MAG: glycosyltransferase family 9 protein [Candidatus Hydrogenedentota bacterium]